MRQKLALLAISFLAYSISFSQDSILVKSKFEDFSSKTGTMLKTETFEVGSEKEYKVSITKIADVETKISVKAVQIYQSKNMFLVGPYVTGILYIDWEEVPGFIKALEFQMGLLETKPENAVSYSYSTLNGVVTTCTYVLSGYGAGCTVTFARVYKHSRQIVTGSGLMVKKKDLADIISLLSKSYAKAL